MVVNATAHGVGSPDMIRVEHLTKSFPAPDGGEAP
jgi:hypothetical protein